MATRRAGNDRESVLIDATLTCIAREASPRPRYATSPTMPASPMA